MEPSMQVVRPATKEQQPGVLKEALEEVYAVAPYDLIFMVASGDKMSPIARLRRNVGRPAVAREYLPALRDYLWDRSFDNVTRRDANSAPAPSRNSIRYWDPTKGGLHSTLRLAVQRGISEVYNIRDGRETNISPDPVDFDAMAEEPSDSAYPSPSAPGRVGPDGRPTSAALDGSGEWTDDETSLQAALAELDSAEEGRGRLSALQDMEEGKRRAHMKGRPPVEEHELALRTEIDREQRLDPATRRSVARKMRQFNAESPNRPDLFYLPLLNGVSGFYPAMDGEDRRDQLIEQAGDLINGPRLKDMTPNNREFMQENLQYWDPRRARFDEFFPEVMSHLKTRLSFQEARAMRSVQGVEGLFDQPDFADFDQPSQETRPTIQNLPLDLPTEHEVLPFMAGIQPSFAPVEESLLTAKLDRLLRASTPELLKAPSRPDGEFLRMQAGLLPQPASGQPETLEDLKVRAITYTNKWTAGKTKDHAADITAWGKKHIHPDASLEEALKPENRKDLFLAVDEGELSQATVSVALFQSAAFHWNPQECFYHEAIAETAQELREGDLLDVSIFKKNVNRTHFVCDEPARDQKDLKPTHRKPDRIKEADSTSVPVLNDRERALSSQKSVRVQMDLFTLT
jgi:hypothetical protein